LHDTKKGDFVYLDPPYQPVSKTANFTSYTTRNFTDDDLERLATIAEKLHFKGCKILISNSKSKKVQNSFSSSSLEDEGNSCKPCNKFKFKKTNRSF